jgi:hypothetical protein
MAFMASPLKLRRSLLDLLKLLFGLHELPPRLLEVLELSPSPLYALLDLATSNLELTVEGPKELGLDLLDGTLGTGRLGHRIPPPL